MYVYPEAGALALQIIIVWMAFFMLQCSKPKGYPKFKYKNKYFENRHIEGQKTDDPGKHEEDQENSHPSDQDEYEEVRLRKKRSCLCCFFCPRYLCCKGDRLINFLIYDFICFGLIVGYLMWYIFGLKKLDLESQIK
jgi:hypothetical protein